MKRRQFGKGLIGLTTLSCLAPMARANAPSSFSAKTLRLVVPFPPGGATDALARTIAEVLAPEIGRQVVVDNKPGGATTIATSDVMRAAPDGGTLLLNLAGTFEILPHVSKVPYTLRDFAPVTEAARISAILVANPGVPANDAKGLAELLRTQPKTVNWAIVSPGSASHMCGIIFNQLAQAKEPLNTVPYKGSATAMLDLIEGRTQLMFDAPTTALPLIRSGKLKALGIMSQGRSVLAPDIATFTEQGFPQLDEAGEGYVGVFAPANTPADTVEFLNRKLVAVLGTERIRSRVLEIGLEPGAETSVAGFTKKIQRNSARWEAFVKSIGFRLD